jgi:hypothetical protein
MSSAAAGTIQVHGTDAEAFLALSHILRPKLTQKPRKARITAGEERSATNLQPAALYDLLPLDAHRRRFGGEVYTEYTDPDDP